MIKKRLDPKIWAFGLGLILLGCSPAEHTYQTGTWRLMMQFLAKEMCSCRFVLKQTEEDCIKYVKVKKLPISVFSDEKTRSGYAKFLWMESEGFWVDEQLGCRSR